MVRDALAGKIDLIVTKSVSRFARNTVDSLTTIRNLKEHGTEVYFEKENIWTFDSKGELLLTIMSSLAQEESRSISENVRWGNKKKFSDGRYSMNYQQLLGYEKGPDGKPAVIPEQAAVVRRIYGLYLTGRTPSTIARILTEDGIPSPVGKKKWYSHTVQSILSNETYMGDKLLQKSYSADFLSKTRVKNKGEVQQYYVVQDHEAIIPPETFKLVQDEIERRKSLPRSGLSVFAGKLFCAECGDFYGRKVWHSNDKYRKVVWRCNGKYAGRRKCSTPTLTEDEIREAFEDVLQQLDGEKAEVIENLRELLGESESEGEMAQKEQLEAEREKVGESYQEMLKTGDSSACEALFREYERLDGEVRNVEQVIREKEAKERRIRAFLEALELPGEEFTEESWSMMVDRVTVGEERMTFLLGNGEEVEILR